MLGLDRSVLRTAWTIFMFVLVLVTVYQIRGTLVLFLLAIFLAHLLAPIVDRVHWSIPPSGSRMPAILVVYFVIIGLVAGLAIPIGSKIGEEAVGLTSRLPTAIPADPLARLPLPRWLESSRAEVDQVIRARLQNFEQALIPTLTAAGEHIATGIGSAVKLILIPILSFFALKDADKIRRALVQAFNPGSRELVEGILSDLHNLMLSYMRALVMLAIATFVSHTIVLSLMGVPYPILLAGIAALLEAIPVIGPLTGATIIVLVAAFSGYPHVLWLILFFAAYRIFQDYVLSPFLMSAGVAIHPLLVLLGILAGEQLGGIGGMFFSVPVIAALRVIFLRLHTRPDETVY